ncbi:MAG: ArdC-like ssDNA-binding domain-containing protein [Spirochaetota bacterium]
MEKKKFDVDWNDVLREALEKPSSFAEASQRLRQYSLGNRALLFYQCKLRGVPVQEVATFKQWLESGRQVVKGAKALAMCVPVAIAKKDEGGEETGEVFRLFRYKRGWFLAQDTKALEHFVAGTETPELAPLDWQVRAALQSLDIRLLSFDPNYSDTWGYARGRTLAINPNIPSPEAALFHELAHIVLGHTEPGRKMSKELKEVEAEATAYICLATLGKLDELDASRQYLQDWLKGKILPSKTVQRIFNAADTILNAGFAQMKPQKIAS